MNVKAYVVHWVKVKNLKGAYRMVKPRLAKMKKVGPLHKYKGTDRVRRRYIHRNPFSLKLQQV